MDRRLWDRESPTTLLEANGIAAPTAPMHVLAQAEPLDVAIWPPARV